MRSTLPPPRPHDDEPADRCMDCNGEGVEGASTPGLNERVCSTCNGTGRSK